jgi:hypothetical protein
MKNQHAGTPQYKMFDYVKKGFPNYNAWKFCVANFIQRDELLILLNLMLKEIAR